MVPPELDAIVMKALAKDPANRYQRMSTFVEDLQKFRRGETVSVMSSTKRARIQRWIKINLPLRRTGTLLAIGAVIGAMLRGMVAG